MSKKNKGLIDFLYQASDLLENWSLTIGGILFIVAVINVVFSVFTRYFLGTSFIWTAELSRYTIVFFVMIVANATLKSGGHMKVEIAYKYFSDFWNNVFKWIRRFISVLVYVLMTYKGFIAAWGAWDKTTIGLGIPRAIPLLSVPIGMLLLLIQYLLMQITEEMSANSR